MSRFLTFRFVYLSSTLLISIRTKLGLSIAHAFKFLGVLIQSIEETKGIHRKYT